MRKTRFVQTITTTLLATLLLGPAAALAQDAPAGISVVGYGQASAPADSATLQMVIGDAFFGGQRRLNRARRPAPRSAWPSRRF